jgi:transposase
MYSFIIGCDMSKAVFDVAYMNQQPVPTYYSSFVNNANGFKMWLRHMKKLTTEDPKRWLVVFENTGIYSKLFKYWLISNQIPCVEENPILINRNAPMKRGKSDPIDAKVICEYGFEKQHKLILASRPDKITEKVNQLYTRRSLLIKHRKALHVSVKETSIILDKDIAALFSMQNEKLLQEYDDQIQYLELLIEQYIQLDEAIHKNYQLAKSVIGIGPITAGLLIGKTHNFTKIDCPRQFASFIGIAPFPNSSGIRKSNNKVSRKGNKVLKTAISNCVQAAIMYDPFFNQYAARLKEKNKPKGIIYNNIKNKLIHRVFSVVKRQSSYIKLAYQ